MWVYTVHETGEQCRLGGSALGCPSWVDVDGDGVITTGDLDAMARYLMQCVHARRHTEAR